MLHCLQVDYVDIWSDHTPYPFNQLPKTYSFMVRNSLIWRVGYYGQQPRFIHVPTQTVSSLFVSRQVGEAFDRYKPDLVVSVHPLMQLVPLRVLRQLERWACIPMRPRCVGAHACSASSISRSLAMIVWVCVSQEAQAGASAVHNGGHRPDHLPQHLVPPGRGQVLRPY